MNFAPFSPWPTVNADGELSRGLVLDLHPSCKACDHHRCKDFHKACGSLIQEHICPKSLSCYCIKDDDTTVFVGLGNPDRPKLPGSFSRFKGYLVKPEAVKTWLALMTHALSQAGLRLTEEVTASIRGLHNILPAVNIVQRGTESVINALPGRDFAAKLQSAPTQVRDLYYGAMLVPWMIDIQNNLVNPSSITYGIKSHRQVYQMIDRLVRSFRVLANSEFKTIRLSGACFRTVMGYDSLANLFVILLDNAVKYSLKDQEILVDVTDSGNHVKVRIESFGPLIKPNEVDKIFRADFRGDYAKKFTNQGTGRGLYIADQIARAHGTMIEYISDRLRIEQSGIPCGVNGFLVRLY